MFGHTRVCVCVCGYTFHKHISSYSYDSLCYQLEVAASIATTIDTLASGLRTLSEIYS